MKQNVKIKVINIKAIAAVDPDEVAHITDENIVETVINSVEFQKMEGMLAEKSEKYNILDITTRLLREELWQLKNQGLIIGFNSPTSNYSCFWCLIKKNQHSDLNANWTISKNMNILRNNCTLYPVIYEVIESGYFDIAREVIIKEMQRIGVCFQFWQERDFNKWSYTSLMGQEKLKCFKNENTDSIEFQLAAKAWLNYFLISSIGNPEDSDFIKGLY
ncbi:hypothetical protein GLOIN_2v1765269 [Rhizophagus irregularis DAOM 181602=DAOM 197198]|nr:hypothetical protein GLOIN_2v1765269 [Rhizophagus irregularis DAOM 181602=DAOM 197198]